MGLCADQLPRYGGRASTSPAKTTRRATAAAQDTPPPPTQQRSPEGSTTSADAKKRTERPNAERRSDKPRTATGTRTPKATKNPATAHPRAPAPKTANAVGDSGRHAHAAMPLARRGAPYSARGLVGGEPPAHNEKQAVLSPVNSRRVWLREVIGVRDIRGAGGKAQTTLVRNTAPPTTHEGRRTGGGTRAGLTTDKRYKTASDT
jgi:hypothetical protein